MTNTKTLTLSFLSEPNQVADLQNNISQIIGEEIANKWFKNIEIISQNAHEIIINCPHKLNRDWINREYFSKKSFNENLKKYYPKLLKISAICLNQNQNFDDKIVNNESFKSEKTNIVNLSKHDNVFAYGTELNNKFTFENYIVGKHNKTAVSMAKIASGIENNTLFDDKIPLYIHGNVGMGKTHLAQAIAWSIKENNPKKKVVYLSAEKFMFHFVQSIRNNDVMPFKEKMRSIDVLIVDDIQFIAGKDSTQQEFMNCFNSLVEDNKQVVLVCDRCPMDLENIDEKLKSRIAGGMIVNFKNPDLSDRVNFLKNKAVQLKFEINDEIINFIAENIKASLRDLEGALKKLYAEFLFADAELNYSNIRNILGNYFKKTEGNNCNIDQICKIVADYFNLKISDLTAVNRSKNIALARQITMFLCKKYTNESLKKIAEKFQKNHATVIHSCKIISSLEETCKKTSQDLKNIIQKIESLS
ncbi:MAG: chromosomal replication initiator protein DnaA [Alphaproteobacteria bacterium]